MINVKEETLLKKLKDIGVRYPHLSRSRQFQLALNALQRAVSVKEVCQMDEEAIVEALKRASRDCPKAANEIRLATDNYRHGVHALSL